MCTVKNLVSVNQKFFLPVLTKILPRKTAENGQTSEPWKKMNAKCSLRRNSVRKLTLENPINQPTNQLNQLKTCT